MFIWLRFIHWNTGETTNVISISSSGIYSVIATDVNGCELNDEIEINFIEPIQVIYKQKWILL